jgi:thiol-disulfide isomerase/thioredoxin
MERHFFNVPLLKIEFMKMKNFLTLFLFCMLVFNATAQKFASLEFSLEGKRFDSLRIATSDTVGNLALFYGKTDNHFNWKFEIPIEIWTKLDRVVLGNANAKKRIHEYVQFLYKSSDDEQPPIPKNEEVPVIIPDWNDLKMKAVYLNSDTMHEDSETMIFHNFSTIPVKLSGMEALKKCPDFSYFPDSLKTNNSQAYNQSLTKYRQLVKDYPDSRLLIIKMREYLNRYRSVADARLVYNLFSEKIRASIFGKEIAQKLLQDWTKFENLTMKNILNGQEETIIQNSTKYTLINLTASWCVYCRKEIPLLKQIYKDLKSEDFEMTSISVDDVRYIQTFKEQVINDSITWRNLTAYPSNISIMKKYAVNGIPLSILVFPDQHIEFMDIRKEEIRNKLYQYVKKQKG